MSTAAQRNGVKRMQFGIFEADLEAGELRRSGVRVHLQSQPFKLLAALLEHPGEVVSRETLQLELWGADTTVDFDHSLGIAMNKLREALNDSAENPRFVETLAKRGYRFIAPVKVVDPHASASIADSSAARARAGSTLGWWLAGCLAFVCLLLGLFLILRQPVRRPYRVVQVTFSGHVLTNDLDVESFSSSASDGTRIYFSHMDNGNPVLAVALAANGEISHFPCRLRLARRSSAHCRLTVQSSSCVAICKRSQNSRCGLCPPWVAMRAAFPMFWRTMPPGCRTAGTAAGSQRQRALDRWSATAVIPTGC